MILQKSYKILKKLLNPQGMIQQKESQKEKLVDFFFDFCILKPHLVIH